MQHKHIFIATSKTDVDLAFVHGIISESYWGKGRTAAQMQKLIEHSLNFSLFLDKKQIGYARLATDYGQFAYVMDVIICPAHQRKGYGLILMQSILAHDLLKDVKTWRLATEDAQALYLKCGFKLSEKPQNLMELKRDE